MSQSLPPTCRVEPGFTGLLFLQHPWFQDFTRVEYREGKPVSLAYLSLSGWREMPLSRLEYH